MAAESLQERRPQAHDPTALPEDDSVSGALPRGQRRRTVRSGGSARGGRGRLRKLDSLRAWLRLESGSPSMPPGSSSRLASLGPRPLLPPERAGMRSEPPDLLQPEVLGDANQRDARGGKDATSALRYSGSVDDTLTRDTARMNLWPGTWSC